MNKSKGKILILDMVLLIFLLLLDQGSKYLAVIRLKEQSAFPLIPGILELHYLENRGVAFGMLQDQKIFILFVAVIFLAIVIYGIYKMPVLPKYHALHILLTVIAGGAIGNVIDRIRFDYVIDFIYIVWIDFPIFNIADMYVSIGTMILVFFLLFVYKEEDFAFLNFKQKKYRELK